MDLGEVRKEQEFKSYLPSSKNGVECFVLQLCSQNNHGTGFMGGTLSLGYKSLTPAMTQLVRDCI
jgi:hypothetical protein